MKSKKNAFTLAETLITLSVLGIVAALTIPSIHRKWQDAYTVSAVRRAYAILDNAIQIIYLTEGKSNTWDIPSSVYYGNSSTKNNWVIEKKFLPYLKVQKYCGDTNGCMPDRGDPGVISDPGAHSYYRTLNNNKGVATETNGGGYNNGKMILSNGMALAFKFSHENNTSAQLKSFLNTGYVRVDINGKKGPNRYGYDVFWFSFNDKGLVLDADNAKALYANIMNSANQCKLGNDGAADYSSCGNWIMRHGNVDYKYRDVSSKW